MDNKPQKQQLMVYDYDKCKNYLEEKYGYDERNYAGWNAAVDDGTPYQDFWHFVCEMGDVHNDSLLSMNEWWFEGAKDWQKEIGRRYLDEFGEGEVGERTILFLVSW